MKAKLTPIGDEHGLLIDEKILELLGISPDTELEITTNRGCLIIEPAEGSPRLRDRQPSPPVYVAPIFPRPVPRRPRDATRVRLPKKQPW